MLLFYCLPERSSHSAWINGIKATRTKTPTVLHMADCFCARGCLDSGALSNLLDIYCLDSEHFFKQESAQCIPVSVCEQALCWRRNVCRYITQHMDFSAIHRSWFCYFKIHIELCLNKYRWRMIKQTLWRKSCFSYMLLLLWTVAVVIVRLGLWYSLLLKLTNGHSGI